MEEILSLITLFMNIIHDLIVVVVSKFGFTVNDKMIHFFFIGIIGIISFILIDLIFKSLVKFGVSVLSFIYTFSIIVVVSFVIEIQQKITGAGNMEFADILYGLWGFLLFLFVLILIKLIGRFIFRKLKISKRHS
ncbi:hypothetical protein MKY07_03185 [Solibacillus sp. FSL W7-1472]|uniref:hypothetical protein n=1 Tax=Solibacillus sp. FSL W7-1472 TaxID=2921707 RepID=UPI0030DA699D